MEVNELRINSWVKSNLHNLETEIFSILSHDKIRLGLNPLATYDISEISGIPLTEEWLVIFGFEKKEYQYLKSYYYSLKVLSHGEIAFHTKEYGFNLDVGTTTGYQFGTTKIKHVHQLQNLYFAITGKELPTANL